MNLYYCNEANLQQGNTVFLDTKNSHHCIKVLRKKIGDKVCLSNGLGSIASCTITIDDATNCGVLITHLVEQAPPPYHFALAISLLKNIDRIEWLLEKITEMGLTEIYLMRCERTEKLGYKEQRGQQILISAMLQSQQCFLPILHPVQEFKDVLQQCASYNNKWIAHCERDASKTYFKNCVFVAHQKNICFIGPEGDFTPQEIHIALQQQCLPIHLGQHRLRTETAGLLMTSHFYATAANK